MTLVDAVCFDAKRTVSNGGLRVICGLCFVVELNFGSVRGVSMEASLPHLALCVGTFRSQKHVQLHLCHELIGGVTFLQPFPEFGEVCNVSFLQSSSS